MHKIGIIGDGYTAAELLRLLAHHQYAKAVCIFSVDNVGQKINNIYPHLLGFSDLSCQATDLDVIKASCQAVFLALPHGLSVPLAAELSSAGIKCIDLGADFRLKDPALYERYYGVKPAPAELLNKAVYGLPELYRQQIKESLIIANPGCYPTSAILPLAPLLKAGVIKPQGIIIDSKSGVSGAGKGLQESSMFCEVNEGIHSYSVGTHRHTPEMAQELSLAAGVPVQLIFTPHLVPINRGILSTIYARLSPQRSPEEIRTVLAEQYRDEPFIHILPPGKMPHTKWVYGSNMVHIGVFADHDSGQIVLCSALDNIAKGASGQAIQNLNIMMGWEETEGLLLAGIHP